MRPTEPSPGMYLTASSFALLCPLAGMVPRDLQRWWRKESLATPPLTIPSLETGPRVAHSFFAIWKRR